MSENIKTIALTVGVLAAGFAINFGLALLSAPGHFGTALLTGVLLTSFGLMIAKFSMEAVMLPLAVISLLWRLVKREKLVRSGKNRDRIEIFGRLLFMCCYSVISLLTGIYLGVLAGGMSWLASGLFFALGGLVWAAMVPEELIWAVESDTNPTPDISTNDRTKPERTQAGDPASRLARKVAKGIVDVVTTDASSGQKKS